MGTRGSYEPRECRRQQQQQRWSVPRLVVCRPRCLCLCVRVCAAVLGVRVIIFMFPRMLMAQTGVAQEEGRAQEFGYNVSAFP